LIDSALKLASLSQSFFEGCNRLIHFAFDWHSPRIRLIGSKSNAIRLLPKASGLVKGETAPSAGVDYLWAAYTSSRPEFLTWHDTETPRLDFLLRSNGRSTLLSCLLRQDLC